MEIVEVDGSDRALFERYYRTLETVHHAGSEFPTVMGLEAAWVWVSGKHKADRMWGLAAVEEDVVLGTAWLNEHLLENTETLYVDIQVDPAHRRQGVGSRLLETVEDIARERGQTMLEAEAVTPYDGKTVFSPGTAFAERHGFVLKHLELHQVIEFPLADTQLDRIATGIAPHHGDYRLVQWDDACPEEWVDRFCDLISLTSHEVPMGELEHEPVVWTVERLRDQEARHRQQTRFGSTTVAVAPDGTLVAYTQMNGTSRKPGILYQGITLVRPEHRGHRLGMAVKIANLRALQARVGGTAVLHTWNAPENAPMIAVNDALGFRPVENNCEYQRPLPA